MMPPGSVRTVQCVREHQEKLNLKLFTGSHKNKGNNRVVMSDNKLVKQKLPSHQTISAKPE